MKKLLLLLSLFLMSISYGQNKPGQILPDVTCCDSLIKVKQDVTQLLDELDSRKKEYFNYLEKLIVENRTLRKIMKGYLFQIDSILTENVNQSEENERLKNDTILLSKEKEQLELEVQALKIRNKEVNQEILDIKTENEKLKKKLLKEEEERTIKKE